jgi:hypothetical protein
MLVGGSIFEKTRVNYLYSVGCHLKLYVAEILSLTFIYFFKLSKSYCVL